MRKWQKMLAAALCAAALVGTASTTYAAYQLNPEVKHATPALKRAAAIGVLQHATEDLQNQADKDAIVVMSFGTTFPDSRKASIDSTVAAIQAAHPGVKVVTAFTSHIIIDRIAKNEGITYPTPEQALADLKKQGYTRIALTSLDVIPGMEYDYDKGVYDNYKEQFKKMTLGTPLMYWQGQEGQADDVTATLQALKGQFPKQGKDDAILIMAHGTPHTANAYYSVIQARIAELGWQNTYVYTVEGWPNLETVLPKLKAAGVKHVTLVPFMLVAGDHAHNDMAGKDADSHKSLLEQQGFTVSTYLHGLGENSAIRALYVDRANAAWDALTK